MKFKHLRLCCISFLVILFCSLVDMVYATHASPEIIVPRLSEIPVVDGRIDEAAWTSAVKLPIEPHEHCKMRIGFNEADLWLALQVKQAGQGTLEIALRVTDCVEEQDCFIVDADGEKRLIRQRIGSTPATSAWQAMAQHNGNAWSVEIRIPFETLGIQPVSGNVFEANAIFRESSKKAQQDVQFSHLYLETRNLLDSPDLSNRSRWSFTEGDENLYTKTPAGVSVQTPGRYSIMQQGLQLQPHAFYRLEVEVKGNASIYVRARTSKRQGDPSDAYTAWTHPREEFMKYVVYFPTGETGDALIIIGSVESSERSMVLLRNLAVIREIQYESAGPRIKLRSAESLVVKKLLVENCCALHGFIASPVDGRLDSPRWDADVWEYNQRGALKSLDNEALQRVARKRGIAEWLVTGNKEPLVDAFKGSIAELQRFPAMYTTAEPFTDRVFLHAITQPAIAYTGGYATRNKFIHTHAVSWEGFGTDFAALVKIAHPDQLTVLLYNFDSKPLEGNMRVWTLRPGRYQLRLGIDDDDDDISDVNLARRTVALQRADKVPLTLPPKQVIVLEMTQLSAHPPLFPRPDLALSAREIHIEEDTLVLPVHNIGSADAPSTEIVVKDEHGQILVEEQVPPLAAPLDLIPKIYTLRLSIPSVVDETTLHIELDAANQIREVYEGNNTVTNLRKRNANLPVLVSSVPVPVSSVPNFRGNLLLTVLPACALWVCPACLCQFGMPFGYGMHAEYANALSGGQVSTGDALPTRLEMIREAKSSYIL